MYAWKKVFPIALVFIFLCSQVLFAEMIAEDREEIRITAEQRGQFKSDTNLFILEGDVKIEKGEMIITSDLARIQTEKKIAEIEGNIKLIQDDVVITSDELIIYFDDDSAIFKENVLLVNHEDDLELNADIIEFNTETQDFVCSGHIFMIQAKNKIWADEGEYNKERNEFILRGNVTIETDSEEVLTAPKVIMNVSDQSFEAVGGVEVKFYIDRS